MSIAVISPLIPNINPIAIYSKYLLEELAKKTGIVIITEKDAEAIKDADMLYILSPRNPIKTAVMIYRELKKRCIKIVHLQWWFQLFYSPLYTSIFLAILIKLLRLMGTKIIVTLHTIPTKDAMMHYYIEIEGKSLFQASVSYKLLMRFLVFMLKNVDHVIVHNELMKRILIEEFGYDELKVSVIPHGVYKPRHIARKREEVRIIFAPGFIVKERNYESLIKAIYGIVKFIHERKKEGEKVKEPILIIAGPTFSSESREYADELKKMVKRYGISNNVIIIQKFLSDKEFEELMNITDLVVILDRDKFVRPSGVLARIMGYGKPLIVTKTPKFLVELKDRYDALFIEPKRVDELVLAILEMIYDKSLREKLSENLKRKTKGRFWSDIADKHLEVYRKVINN